MAILQPYDDVPAIELGAEDYPAESFRPYAPVVELGQYWRSIDPGLNPRAPLDMYQAATSAHLVNMEKHLRQLSDTAYGCGHSPAIALSEEDPPRLGLNTLWGGESEAVRTMRYMSPTGHWGGSWSSTNSTPSDYAFSPDVSRHQQPLFRDELDCHGSYGSPYPVPFPQGQYSYPSLGPAYGQVVASSAPGEQAAACSMRDIQLTPDPENEDLQGESDCIQVESRPPKLAATPEDRCPGVDNKPSQSEYEDSVKDVDEEKSVDSDVDPEYSPVTSRPIRRISTNRHLARSPTLSRNGFFKPATQDAKVLKSSQREIHSTRRKAKNVSRRRSGTNNGNSRPFICSFSHYGCASRFSSKNEWKRHVASQHLQLGFYRCDTEQCNPTRQSPSSGSRPFNDFNRKDLFTQHHRRMHTPWSPANKPPSKRASEMFEDGLEAVRQRCWRQRRQAPRASQCIFCLQRFEGESAWEERMEHIGKHFEKAEREKKDLGPGMEDPELRKWALEQGIVVYCGDKVCLLQGSQADRGAAKTESAARTRRGKIVEVDDVEEDEDEDAAGDEE